MVSWRGVTGWGLCTGIEVGEGKVSTRGGETKGRNDGGIEALGREGHELGKKYLSE